MIRENTGPTKVPLIEPIFSSKIIRFFFQFQPENAKWILRRKLSKLLMLVGRNSRRVSHA